MRKRRGALAQCQNMPLQLVVALSCDGCLRRPVYGFEELIVGPDASGSREQA